MSKKTGMNADMFKKIIKKKKKKKKKKERKKERKKASSHETVSLCSPKAKNIVEMSLLYIKFCFVLFC